MSVFSSVFGSIRDAMILSERMNTIGEKADKALAMSQETRERVVRLETILEMARQHASSRRLPRE